MSTSADLRLRLHATAIVCVDFQNDFCSPGGFFEQAGHDVAPCAAAAARTAVVAAACREAGVPVVLTRTVRTDAPQRRLRPSRHPGDETRGTAAAASLGNDRYLPDAWGSQIVPQLTGHAGDVVVEKSRQSPFFRTPLEDELRARGIEVVVVAGVTTNCCVDSTIRDASMRDFDVLVLGDCVAGSAPSSTSTPRRSRTPPASSASSRPPPTSWPRSDASPSPLGPRRERHDDAHVRPPEPPASVVVDRRADRGGARRLHRTSCCLARPRLARRRRLRSRERSTTTRSRSPRARAHVRDDDAVRVRADGHRGQGAVRPAVHRPAGDCDLPASRLRRARRRRGARRVEAWRRSSSAASRCGSSPDA